MRIKGYTQITWSKICFTNEYYTKTDFPQEKIILFSLHYSALVKIKVGKMCLFLQTLIRL